MNVILAVIYVLVFVSAFLLIRAMTSIVMSKRQLSRDLENIFETSGDIGVSTETSFLRRPHLERLSNFENAIEKRSEFQRLKKLVDQAGVEIPIYRLLMYSVALAIISATAAMLADSAWWVIVLATFTAASTPILGLLWLRARRIAKLEMQLADAIDMVKRSLRAGNPLVSTFRLVSKNMNDPIAREFGITAADLSYGNDPRSALLAMLERVPSIALRGFVTAILVQRESGGNLAEALDHISEVIRRRFRFERKLRTLSAEGRLSAWILIAIPFALGAVLHLTSPDYLRGMLDDPRGPSLLTGGAILMAIGVIWIRRISRIAI